ncbi:MAG: hypothetical protein ACYTFX_02240 [Planctomycetota bacterium]|jgi:hypothetical protein
MNRLFVIAACVMVFFTSCTNKEYQEQEMVNTLTLHPTPQETCIQNKQIIYHRTLNPEPLNQEQLKILSAFVCDTKPNYVWFVRVLYNRQNMLRADIYFLPDYSLGRLRKGKVAYYDSFFGLTLPKRLLEEQGFDPNEVPKPEYHEYVDVLPEYYSPSLGQIPYTDYLMPFSVSDDFTDQEIIEIVDFIRSYSAENLNPYEESLHIDTDLPIMSITKKGENIKVGTGTREGPEAGMGQEIHLQKTDDGYEIKNVILWVS